MSGSAGFMEADSFWLAEDMASFAGADFERSASLSQMSSQAREECWATMALRHCPGLGARSLAKLLKGFGSALAACRAPEQWQAHGVNAARGREFEKETWRPAAREEWQNALKLDAAILLWRHDSYPSALRQLPDAPALLYAKGDLNLLNGPCVAIVGARDPTANGRRVAAAFGRALAASGVTVVSGMALGIDGAAQGAAIEEIGASIGVLGAGIDIVYPRTNREIFEAMLHRGLLLSEFPPGTPPKGANFPIRNRIISGLCLGTLVVEAAMRSGSLVTARLALEQNRELFVIPGPALDSHSLGCQSLARQGATPVFSPDDILRDLAVQLKAFGLRHEAVDGVPEPDPRASKKARVDAMLTPPADSALADNRGQNYEKGHKRDNAEAKKRESWPAGASKQEESLDAAIMAVSPDVEAAARNLLAGDAAARALAALSERSPAHQDVLAEKAGLSAGELTTALLGLEMTGRVRRLPGAYFEIIKRS